MGGGLLGKDIWSRYDERKSIYEKEGSQREGSRYKYQEIEKKQEEH